MAKSRKSEPRKKLEVLPLTDKQLSKARLLAAEELGTNPEIFNLPESKRSFNDIVNFFVKVSADQAMRKILPRSGGVM